MKKIFLMITLLFVVNGNFIYGGENYESQVWNDLQQKRKNSIEKIAELDGINIKAVYFDSLYDDFNDNDIWQDGYIHIKYNIPEKTLKGFIDNNIDKSWKKLLKNEKNEEKTDSEQELNSISNDVDFNYENDIDSVYLHGISQDVKVRDKEGDISHGTADSVSERITIVKFTENSNDRYMFYDGDFERKNYESIINLYVDKNKIRINNKSYTLNSSICLKNDTVYIPIDAAKIILNYFNINSEKYLKKFYGNGMVLINDKLYFPYRKLIQSMLDNKSAFYYDSDLKMVSSISMNLDEMQKTYYGYFE